MTNKASIKQIEELKTCPFCGAIPGVNITSSNRWFVMCQNSECLMLVTNHIHYVKKQKAIAAWNKRADNGGNK